MREREEEEEVVRRVCRAAAAAAEITRMVSDAEMSGGEAVGGRGAPNNLV